MSKNKTIEVNGFIYKLADDRDIPTDDPNLPSYESSCYLESKSNLKFIDDFYNGDVKTYLPKFERENNKAYKNRVERTLYKNFFKDSVKGFPGFLSDITSFEEVNPCILDRKSNVDLLGNDIFSFLWQADIKVIKDGFCGILTEMPILPRYDDGKPIIYTLADLKRNPDIRPYWVLIDRANIVNFNTGKDGLEQVVIREYCDQKVGRFGSQKITKYRTFDDDGNYTVEVICQGDDKEFYSVILDEGCTTLKEMPLTIYSATDINPLEAKPPLQNVADKTKAYYELYSEYRNIIFMMGSPGPVRTGLITPGQTDFSNVPDMVFGNTGIDLPIGGTFEFKEVKGDVLGVIQEELKALESSINLESLKFLSGEGKTKTATEARLESVNVASTLKGMVKLKESMFETIADKWASYCSCESCKEGLGGKISINDDLLAMPLDSQDLTVLSKMVTDGQLSVITLLELMKEGKRLPAQINPSKEVQRLSAQLRLREKQSILRGTNGNFTNSQSKS
jgi:hypothetical protein